MTLQGGTAALGSKNVAEQIASAIVESYESEAELLGKIAEYTERARELAKTRDFVALYDSLLGRGERIESCARLEVRRKQLNLELAGVSSEGGDGGHLPDARSAETERARRKAAGAHRHAIKLDEELRATLEACRSAMEEELAGLAQGKAATRAYDGRDGRESSPVFLDREG